MKDEVDRLMGIYCGPDDEKDQDPDAKLIRLAAVLASDVLATDQYWRQSPEYRTANDQIAQISRIQRAREVLEAMAE